MNQQRGNETRGKYGLLSKHDRSVSMFPISITEPRSDVPGGPTSPFSAQDRKYEKLGSHRHRGTDSHGQNILSPAAIMSSMENISPCPKQYRPHNNLKACLNIPAKSLPLESKMRQRENPQRNDILLTMEAFGCLNQASGSTKPHTAKRSPEFVLTEQT